MQYTHKMRVAGHLELKHTGCWYIIVRTTREFRSINTGTKNRAEAQGALEKFLANENKRKNEALAKIPLAKVWELYDESPNAFRSTVKIKRKKRSAWLYFAEWMHEIHPEIDAVAKITPSVVNEYMNHYRSTHTATTCNNKLVFFTGMFNVLVRDGVVSRNPWMAVKKFPKDGNSRRELTSEEVGRVIAEAANKGDEWRDLIMIGVYTGLRLGDCCLLDWKDIDLENMIIQVTPRKTAKYANGQPVTIPIHPQLLEVLSKSPYERRRGYVLRTIPDLYLNHGSTLTGAIKEIFTDAGIETSIMIEGRHRPTPYATFHSLRHSFVSFATNSGVPLAVVQSIVGHRSSAMTRHYYHANEEALRKAVDAVPDFEKKSSPRGDGVGGPVHESRTQQMFVASGGGRSIVERMKEAMTLFKEGMVSEGEFNGLRRRILASA